MPLLFPPGRICPKYHNCEKCFSEQSADKRDESTPTLSGSRDDAVQLCFNIATSSYLCMAALTPLSDGRCSSVSSMACYIIAATVVCMLKRRKLNS